MCTKLGHINFFESIKLLRDIIYIILERRKSISQRSFSFMIDRYILLAIGFGMNIFPIDVSFLI